VPAEEAPLSDLDSTSMEGEVEISLLEIITSCPVPAPGRQSACTCVRADFVNCDARCLIAFVGFVKRATVYRAVKLPKMVVSGLCEEGKFAGNKVGCGNGCSEVAVVYLYGAELRECGVDKGPVG
jgi:hypothetical protein